MKITDKDIRHLWGWMNDMTQDAQMGREEKQKLTKSERGDLRALDTCSALIDKYQWSKRK